MSVMSDLSALSRHSSPLSVRDFETTENQPSTMSTVAELKADTVIALKGGRRNPLKLAVPAYQSFETAGDGTEQTFSLSESVVDVPDTQAAVVWFGGEYQGVPSIDFEADTITVTGPGSVETVHTFYVSDAAATIELRKSLPSAKTDAAETLYEANLSLVQSKNQNEQPEYLSLNASELQPFLAADMDLSVRVSAPYPIRFEDPDGDGAVATNALLHIPAFKGQDTISGLSSEISADMSGR